MSPHAVAEDVPPAEPLLMPPLYRSEGFAEDLLDNPDAPDRSSLPAAAGGGPPRAISWTVPLATALPGAAKTSRHTRHGPWLLRRFDGEPA